MHICTSHFKNGLFTSPFIFNIHSLFLLILISWNPSSVLGIISLTTNVQGQHLWFQDEKLAIGGSLKLTGSTLQPVNLKSINRPPSQINKIKNNWERHLSLTSDVHINKYMCMSTRTHLCTHTKNTCTHK